MKGLMIAAIVLIAGAAGAAAQAVLEREPASGVLREGQQVYVDDRSCPKGQIKLVTGGKRNAGMRRSRQCVPRPR